MSVTRSWRRGEVWGVAVAAVAVAGAAVAAVPAVRAPLQQGVYLAGTLTYVWHGDPSRGCAAKRLCGEHGSLTVSFDRFGQLTSVGRHGSVQLDGASGMARVRRDDPGSRPGACVDEVPIDSLGIRLDRVRGAQYVATIDASPASSGRCAGPLASELAHMRLPASRLGGHGLGFDLQAQAGFAAGPFSGELISTVVLRPDLSDQGGSGTSVDTFGGGGAPPPPSSHRRVLVEYARLRYALAGASGALQVQFAGDGEPYCEPLDDCGVAGSLTLSVTGYRGTVVVSASRPVNRRYGARRALADLRAGRLQYDIGGLLLSKLPATVSESMTRSGGASCTDTTAAPISVSVDSAEFQAPRGALAAVIGSTDGATDALRTHCPGPSTTDVSRALQPFGPSPSENPLAQGLITPKALGSRQIMLSLRNPGRFVGAGFSGTRSGALQFSLKLLAARAGTRSERA